MNPPQIVITRRPQEDKDYRYEYTVAHWEELESWGMNNSTEWNHAATAAKFANLSEMDTLKCIAATLLVVLEDAKKRAIDRASSEGFVRYWKNHV